MYEYVTSATRAEEIGRSLLEEKSFGYDLETTGLDPHVDKVILASISTRKNTYLIDTRDLRCMEALREPLEREDIKKLGFYHMFDYSMTKGYAGIDLEGSLDIQLAEKTLVAGLQWDGFNLEAVTKKYIGKERDKSLQKSFINHKGEFTKGQLQYAAEDTADLFPLADAMYKQLEEAGLTKIWTIENEALPAFADIYFYGMKIDENKWKDIMKMNYEQMQKAELELATHFEPFFDRDLFGHLDINFNSQQSILYGLQRMGIKVDGEKIRDTNDDTRKKIGHLPVIQALANHREALKAYGTYGQPYLDRIHEITRRIHPRMDQYGTDTGRSTCPKPNVLNIPREEHYRHAFITEMDRMISTVDFSGAELRIMADQSGDELMIKGFNMGVDFHCYVATMLFKRPELIGKKDPLRTPTKALNFGLAYGMGPAKLFQKLNGEGHKITLDECKNLFKEYKSTFKTVVRWLDDNKKVARAMLEMRNIAGRRRRWHAPDLEKAKAAIRNDVVKQRKGKPLTDDDEFRINELAQDKVHGQWAGIEREGANFNVQSTNVEWTKTSMAQMRREFKKRKLDARFYNSVYDETVLDVATKDSYDVHELQKKIMIECGQKYCSKVPVEVEGHLEPYWTK